MCYWPFLGTCPMKITAIISLGSLPQALTSYWSLRLSPKSCIFETDIAWYVGHWINRVFRDMD